MAFEYVVCDWLTRKFVANLNMTGVTFGDPLTGHGQLQGTLVLDMELQDVAALRTVIEADRAALFVVTGNRNITWSGRIISAPWTRNSASINITAVQTSQILAECLHGVGHTTVRYSEIEQFQIARNLIAYMNGLGGYPYIHLDAKRSGVLKTLTIEPQSFVELDSLLDGLSRGAKGFDWSIQARFATRDGLPEFYLAQFYPERGSQVKSNFLLQSTPNGGNIIDYGEFPMDLTERRTDIFALGDGEVPAMMVSRSTDSGIATRLVPRRMKSTSYSGKGIVIQSTLAEHARSERKALADTTGTLVVTCTVDDPDINSYLVGDRFRLRIQDMWLDVDLPAVRCVDRSVKDEDRDTTAEVSLTLDLNDNEPPEV